MADLLDALRARCDDALARLLGTGDSRLEQAMRYAVLGGGKRLRPLLVYASGQACGVPLARLDPAACAIELIHAYSLVHDDLPAMDDDDLRRGRATVHRAFDEATAILAGDALQSLAFEVLAGGVGAGLPAPVVLAQTLELARASGAAGMAGGQAMDLALVGAAPGLDTLTRMHALKTGALILAAVRLGAAAAAQDDPVRTSALERYGRDLGLAFQIQDDVLDEAGDSAVTGKAVGADRARGKPTFTTLLGVQAARRQAQTLIAGAREAVARVGGETAALEALAQRLADRRA